MNVAVPLYSSLIANCVFNAFSSYTAIMLNIVTIHALRKTSSLPKHLKTLLLSLAVSDLGVGLLAQPLYIALMVKQLQQSAEDSSFRSTYTALTTMTVLFGYYSTASFFIVVAISVDRFLAIHLHLRYQELVTHKRVVAVVILIWVLSAVLSLLGLWIRDITKLDIVIAFILGLCFIFTTVFYCIIYSVVRRHTNQMQALQVHQEAQNEEMENVVRQRKSAVSTFYVYLVFLVCYLPDYCTSVVLHIISDSSRTEFTDRLFLYTLTLMFLNSSLNPVIYCWKMRHIRHAIVDILRNIIPSQN
ncbi:adenosine receptor A2b-like [Oculina patagonica]